jgi:DNA-binding CsgD family transcriptional regulator
MPVRSPSVRRTGAGGNLQVLHVAGAEAAAEEAERVSELGGADRPGRVRREGVVIGQDSIAIPHGVKHQPAQRDRQTLDALMEGDSEKEAALRLGLSVHTIHEYVNSLYRRFGVSSRAELLAHFLRRGRGNAAAT